MIDLIPMKNSLWEFKNNRADFTSTLANKVKSLYFPLCNAYPVMSSLSPDLHGDLKTGLESFLLEPVSRLSLLNSKSSRNFWINAGKDKIWSATGASKLTALAKFDQFQLDAGMGWQTINRKNNKLGLNAKITSFVPASTEPLEIMLVEITNISRRPIKFTPTAAIPIFGRSANNLHDHRHVTSLLSRITKNKFGVAVTPTLAFDETGHKQNNTSYFVSGIDEKSFGPQYIYATQEDFVGESGDLEAPEAILTSRLPSPQLPFQGKEPMAALRFRAKTLAAKKSFSYIVLMGIIKDKNGAGPLLEKFNSLSKVTDSLKQTKLFWQNISANNSVESADKNFDNWLKWVNIQPTLRKIFGCSFLPDFDYGKGGRGWRDLWQDCLALILNNPSQVKQILINNFSGVRIDGSNATIIGAQPGEFIADRNNIPRVWMDHGIWPLVTTLLYIHQTGDLQILNEETTYFRDPQLYRSRQKDLDWKPEYGNLLKSKNGNIYKGTILEHILLQNLVQFFNVGAHNLIRLEGADWNDGLDMAGEFGESVAFSAMYAQNLNTLCEILENLNTQNFTLLKEINLLLDSPGNYNDINYKKGVLESYFQAVKTEVGGEKISLPAGRLIADLKNKAQWLIGHIRKTEWLSEGFFNGYYDNNKRRVEGRINGLIRMTLTGQVFPVMSGIATEEQTRILFKNCQKYLKDQKLGGFRLNTDFKEEQLALGRAFSFIYGDKENGAFFNHMSVMFAYALYKRGFAKEGFEVLSSIYKMALDTQKSKIYPCLPEYFNSQGRGMYCYLTGSASWFILTLVTQVFGLRGEYGNLIIEPKLVASQFKKSSAICLNTSFAERTVKIKFLNPGMKDFGRYCLDKISINGKIIKENIRQPRFILKRDKILALPKNQENIIEVLLS